jgi:hypothetical protein
MQQKLFLAVVFILSCSTGSLGQARIPRCVLALYSSEQVAQADLTNAHSFAEMPLNYLGLYVRYWDLEKGLPPDRIMKNCRGIFVWSNDVTYQDTEAYARWLLKNVRNGKRLVVIGNPGIADPAREDIDQLLSLKKAVFQEIGISYRSNITTSGGKMEYTSIDQAFMQFERDLPDTPPAYQQLRAQKKATSHLSVNHREYGSADLVVTHPGGGFVSSGYAIYPFQTSDRVNWYLNPFQFFRRAFDTSNLPVPNLCLLNGNRILFSSIDGDGFLSLSRVDGTSSAGRIIYEEIQKRDSIPAAVSFIGVEMKPGRQGTSKNDLKLARKIAALPHVEGASHTWTHPIDWETGEGRYELGEDHVFSVQREIDKSISFLNDLIFSRVNDSVRIYLWSGDARPGPEAFRYLEKHGLPNMNGGLSRRDELYPSITNVTAFGRPVGRHLQTYAQAGSDYVYTSGWQKNHHAFRQVKRTWKNTDSERLLKPIHLYYHFYSGDRKAGLHSLQVLYEYLEEKKTTPIFPSRYARMVQDFYQAEIHQENGGYRLENWGEIRTMTFRNQHAFPDLTKSKGVIGFRHRGDHTHLYLDERDTYFVHLSETPPDQPYITGATGRILSFKVTQRSGTIDIQAPVDMTLTVGGMTARQSYQVGERTIRTNKQGELRIPIDVADPGKRSVRLRRR